LAGLVDLEKSFTDGLVYASRYLKIN